jgi:hypothetical protein
MSNRFAWTMLLPGRRDTRRNCRRTPKVSATRSRSAPSEERTTNSIEVTNFHLKIAALIYLFGVIAKGEAEDVLQCNNKPSSQTARGHQGPAAFLVLTSGLDKVSTQF